MIWSKSGSAPDQAPSALAGGAFDQTDAFSDITDQLAGLLDRLRGRIPNRERDDKTLAALN